MDSDFLGGILSCEMDIHHTKLHSWEIYFPSLPYIWYIPHSTEHTSSRLNSRTLPVKQEGQGVDNLLTGDAALKQRTAFEMMAILSAAFLQDPWT